MVAIQILRDLRGLRVQVVHPPDNERISLVEHLRRIGCMVDTQWPVPETWSDGFDVVLLAVEHDVRSDIQRLLKSDDGPLPFAELWIMCNTPQYFKSEQNVLSSQYSRFGFVHVWLCNYSNSG